jgi:hypothetical protein
MRPSALGDFADRRRISQATLRWQVPRQLQSFKLRPRGAERAQEGATVNGVDRSLSGLLTSPIPEDFQAFYVKI